MLDHTTLSDPDTRRTVVTARDLPLGLGDMDASLYLLFKEIRTRSTVALSGESADEVFGGYRWFHDPVVQRADMFPWVAAFSTAAPMSLLTEEATAALDLGGYLEQNYRDAVSEVDTLPGESEHEQRMRVICHLHLTRFVRMLLDRKDRMSMAVGLEVRVPFCDHRLVEYVYNTPWSLKTFDGREKSLLRAAARNVLPDSVAQRVKSPYPSTQDPQYAADIQQQAKDLLADRDGAVFGLIDHEWVSETSQQDPATLTTQTRHGLERVLDLAVWLDNHRPEVRLS